MEFSLAVLAVMIFVLPAAVSDAQDTNNLIGTNWQLTTITSGDTETPAIAGSRVILQLNEDNQVAGSGGCNTYGGSYTIEGDAITFAEIVSTLMACADDSLSEQEQTYFAALQSATTYELSGDQLIIHFGEGQGLVFTQVGIPANSEWLLLSFGAAGEETPVVEGTVITLEFGADNRVSGSGGCNTYSSSYVDEGGTLAFSPIVSTKRACAQSGATQQEQTYFAALQSATRYELSGNQLIVHYGDSQQLLFERINVLNNSQWQLASIGGTPVIAGSAITLEFGENNQVGGSGGCNTYGGSYTMEDDTITFSDIFSTLMACLEGGIMEQEQVYFAALNSATRYEISSDQLIIEYDDGQQLVFTSATSQ